VRTAPPVRKRRTKHQTRGSRGSIASSCRPKRGAVHGMQHYNIADLRKLSP
jgi:hypothetical protein